MISVLNIGNNGRLGNQLFQFSTVIGVSDRTGFQTIFPNNKNFRVPEIFDIDKSLITNENIILPNQYNEKQFNFDDSIFNIQDNTTINGYFQTEKYFKDSSDKLRNILKFNSEISNEAIKIINRLKQTYENIISIHLRCGDYRLYPNHHPICTENYYKEAIKHFNKEKTIFLIFSDENQLFINNFFNFIDNKLTIKTNYDGIDLCLMSKCDHNIIANSSFSWWGAWLNDNKNKTVIAPTPWFGRAYSEWDTSDLYCKNWIKHEC